MKCLDTLCKPKPLFVCTAHIQRRAESYFNAYQFRADRTDGREAHSRMCQKMWETGIQGSSVLSVNQLTQECIFDSCPTFYLFQYLILAPVSKNSHPKKKSNHIHTQKAAAFKITDICQ